MFYYYDVYYNGQPVLYNVWAMSEKDAGDQGYMRDTKASASAYTGRAKDNYRAVKK